MSTTTKMTGLLRIARRPPILVFAGTTVLSAVRTMAEHDVGAVLVREASRPLGIFTERDLMLRVVRAQRDSSTTAVSAVMTSPVLTLQADVKPTRALAFMLERHIRHLPIVDAGGDVIGMLSMRQLMRDRIERLEDEVDSIVAYIGCDGIGG